ncbi:MAG: alcohol dehydrogenase catalytic domain-containing protein, partial [Myxococcota bacterium]|nr:alcohol dehydrogenase catalytic domain-containing protein [Myxococcota bacterium]
MKALILKEKNQSPQLEERVLRPLRTGYARVKITAAALNRRDVWIMRGQYPGLSYPVILGSDGCGVVVSVADPSSEWLHRRVVLYPAFEWGGRRAVQSPDFRILGMPDDGTFAEYIDIPVPNLRNAPQHLTDAEAAALPLAGLTAWRAVMTRGRLQAGEKVFVTGIGGGVALMAAQLARAAGATVVVSSHSDAKLAQAMALGLQ